MFEENELIPISALQHVLFCERQFALIHVEQIWQENRYTVEGQILHERVDVRRGESRKFLRHEYGLHVRSLELGLVGICDLVEVNLDLQKHPLSAVPVEFKRGRTKHTHVDLVQLCAQALCLEEMLKIQVRFGQLYYLQEHRRIDIVIDDSLVDETKHLIERCRELLVQKVTPHIKYSSTICPKCSLYDFCSPKIIGEGGKHVEKFVQNAIKRVMSEEVSE